MGGGADIPDDENGDVLRRMIRNGDDLSIARPVNFEQIFPDKPQAFSFLASASDFDRKVALSWYAAFEVWNVCVTCDIAPSHSAVSRLEAQFDQLAKAHGGKADGWG